MDWDGEGLAIFFRSHRWINLKHVISLEKIMIHLKYAGTLIIFFDMDYFKENCWRCF